MNLDKETGVSVMKIAEQLDTGPVCNTYKIDLTNNLNAIDVSEKLYLIAAEKILDNVDDILDEGVTLREVIDYCKGQGASEVLSAVLLKKNKLFGGQH